MKSWIIVAISCLLARGTWGAVPAWTAATGTATVAEDAAVDTVVAVTQTLTDAPTAVTIVSTAGTSDATAVAAFSAALNAGADGVDLKVKATGVLDRETALTLTLHLRASNAEGDNAADLVLTITVTDANDNAPAFNPMYMCAEMMADTAATTAVTAMVATDADAGSNVLATDPYAFTSGTASTATAKFDIAAGTGAVTVKSGQTLTASSEYTLYIQAIDGGTPVLTGTGTLSVCVGAGCCSSGAVVIQGALAVVVLGLLSLFM